MSEGRYCEVVGRSGVGLARTLDSIQTLNRRTSLYKNIQNYDFD